MPNKKIADSIANALRSGTLVHPGRDGGEATPVVLPMFRTEGMPPEMAELVEGTAQLMAEAIVAHIEADHEIVATDELKELRAASDTTPVRQVVVHCRCDTGRVDPLAILSVSPGSQQAIIDGKALLSGLAARSVECPHRRNS